MRRREVIAGISVAGIAGPLRLRAQPTGKPIFGILLVFSREGGRTSLIRYAATWRRSGLSMAAISSWTFATLTETLTAWR